MIESKRMPALLLSFVSALVFSAPPASAAPAPLHQMTPKSLPPLQVLDRFVTKDGRKVTLVAGDMALVTSKNGTQSVRYLPDVAMATRGILPVDRSLELAALNKAPAPAHPYVNGSVLVILRSGTGLRENVSFTRADLAAKRPYSNDVALNQALGHLGVTSVRRLLTSIRASDLSVLANAYLVQITHGTVSAAIDQLRALSSVVDAEPNFYVGRMNTYPVQIPKRQIAHALELARSGHDRAHEGLLGAFRLGRNGIPSNYAVAYSAQSALNAPGVNAIAAYDEIERHFRELPGAGEIVTNVSVGDVVDEKALLSGSPCSVYDNFIGLGPTVALIGGQHYLEMPSLPAIPAYVASDDGTLSGSDVACGQDPSLSEVGLDFSVMAALPHQLQQFNETGSGYSDLLGIAPGASYRLVVPKTTASSIPAIAQGPTSADLIGALVGAAVQQPAPNVINMSLGFGFDTYGFPSRYLEEDPALQAAVSYVVAKGIVVTIAAGDGLRMYTNAPVGPSGGTVALDTVTSGGTNIADDAFSTIPSEVTDSGAIAVGGTTLDDIMSAPPSQRQYAAYRDQLTFPEVRWNGFGSFASTFGSRVDISAPSDNILADYVGGTTFEGGTSAAAPMVAAAAAVALQVARLSGKPLRTPKAVRKFLVSTARPVPNVLQADVPVNVGPQLDVGAEVETLLRDAHAPLNPVLNRVAVAQRYPESSEFVFSTDTDPTAIDLNDTYAMSPGQAGSSAFAPITIAPDWEEMPAGTKFRLFLQGQRHNLLSTGPWARVFPKELLAATGQPFYSSQPRTVNLEYQAYLGFRLLAHASIALTFSPNQQVLQGVGPAPEVPSTVTGDTIPVEYDIRDVDPRALSNPRLIVSYPGRMSTWTSGNPGYKALYTIPIVKPKGKIDIPVSTLQGNGIYGIAIQINTWANLEPGYTVGLSADAPIATTWAYTRVASASARPPAPILSYQGDATFPLESGHAIDVSYDRPFQVAWNVNNVKGATGATLEISALGPSLFGNYNPFNNPNGSKLDANGVDWGSTYKVALMGTRGRTIVNPWPSIAASNYYTIRVLATSGNQVVGEAGDVSTIATHGIIPSDNGSLLNGFGVSQGDNIGILTSNQLDSTNRVDSSVQVFDPHSLGIDYTLDDLSTDSGLYNGGQRVPMYDLNGFGMDPNGSSYLAVESQPWSLYPGFAPPSALKYVPYPQEQPSNPDPQCGSCVDVPQNFIAQGNFMGSDYLLASGSSGMTITPATWGSTGLTLGTPVPMATPSGSSYCNGFTAGSSEAIGAFQGSSGLQLQLANLFTGQSSTSSAISQYQETTCNLSVVNSSVATAVTDYGFQGVLYSMPASGGALVPTPLAGYIPLTLTQLQGSQIFGWAVMSAIEPDYLTNANATSTVSIVDWYLHREWYGPIGSIANITVPLNNRLSATGSGGKLYLIGANGYEIAPFVTGL